MLPYPLDTSGGLSIGVHSGFNPHPVSVFFLPHDGDNSSFVHLIPPNSTVDKNAPSPLVVYCANSNANASTTSTTCSSWQPSNQYVPSPTSSTTAVSLYRSVALARIPHSTAGHPPPSSPHLITQKNENLKSADTFLPTHAADGTRKVAPVKSSTWVERVRFEIRYLRGGGDKSKAKSKAWWNSETSGSKAREWKW